MSPELVSIVFYATPYTRRFLIKAKQVFLSFVGFKLFILASLLTFFVLSVPVMRYSLVEHLLKLFKVLY